jgi:hypothetical protein
MKKQVKLSRHVSEEAAAKARNRVIKGISDDEYAHQTAYDERRKKEDESLNAQNKKLHSYLLNEVGLGKTKREVSTVEDLKS